MCRSLIALLLLAAASPLRAETNPFLQTAPSTSAPASISSGSGSSSIAAEDPRWGFNLTLGYGGITGDFSTALQKPLSGDFSLFRTAGPWRFGLGLNFGSFVLRSPYDQVKPQVTIVGYPVGDDWAFHQIYLSATRTFRMGHTVRPYLQVRGGLARMHPRSLVFAPDPTPPDFVPESSPTKATNGFAVGVVPGIEWKLSRSISLDTAFSWTYFDTGSYDLSPIGLPPESWGESWEARLGLVWHLDDGQPSGPAGKSVSPDRVRDAWGVERNYGWAAAEVLAINIVATEMEEFKSNLNYTQTSDRSWWRNFETGGTYDDNLFRNNQLIHPYNGATYFNGARANGLNFWTSYAYAFAGSFFWECCSENHPIALNDQVSTGIGGPAMGEVLFRLSSEILDNHSTGFGRVGREAAAFLVDPVRGLNRGLSGRWGAQDDNPVSPMDWKPSGSSTFAASGIRTIGEGDSIKNSTDSYAFVEFDHAFGNEFENPRRKPFDYFDTEIQFNFGDKHPIGEFRIRGDLWTKPLGSGDHPNHVFSIVQHYEYMNNTDYEFGGQSFGPSLLSRFRLSDRLWLQTRVDGIGMLLGGINSDYSHFAQVADVTRLREYDYGSGLGVAAEATLALSRWPLVKLAYRFQWLNVHNGSVFDRGPNLQGEDADHYIQFAGARLSVPLFRGLGIGGDAYLFLRDSHYQFQILGATVPENLHQRNPQVHVYLSWGSRG